MICAARFRLPTSRKMPLVGVPDEFYDCLMALVQVQPGRSPDFPRGAAEGHHGHLAGSSAGGAAIREARQPHLEERAISAAQSLQVSTEAPSLRLRAHFHSPIHAHYGNILACLP